MLFINSYYDYFEHQAIHHPDLLHDPTSNRKVFDVISVEEALGDFRSNISEKGYLFRLILPTGNLTDGGSHEMRKHLNGGFIVAHYHKTRGGDSRGLITAMAKAEKLGDEIIEKMIADSKAGHPLFYSSLNRNQQITTQPKIYTGDGGYSGFLYMWKISNWWRNCITHANAPNWGDGGQTPWS